MQRMECSGFTKMMVSERLKKLPSGYGSGKLFGLEQVRFSKIGNVFADPTYDNSFKFAFGGEPGKENMKRLMDAIYEELNIDRKIGPLFAKDRELDGSTLDEKTMHLDTFFLSENGDLLNVEMQKNANWEPSLLISRMKAQICRIKYSNLTIGAEQQAYQTRGVVNVLFTNYVLNPKWPVIVQEVIGEFGMSEADPNQVGVDRIIIVQLGKFKKQIEELKSDFDVYLYLLVNMGRLLEIPPQFDNEKFRPFFDKLRINNLNKKQMNLLTKEQEAAMILNYRVNKGRAEGEAKGEKKATLLIIKRLLLAGKCSVEEIADLTGTTVEEVMKVRASIN